MLHAVSEPGASQPKPKRDVYIVTDVGMWLLYVGIAGSILTLVFPITIEHWAGQILQYFGVQPPQALSKTAADLCVSLGFAVHDTLTPSAVIVQSLWLFGAVLLMIQPWVERKNAIAFFVFEVSMVLASALPLMSMSFANTVVLRIAFTFIVLAWLESIENKKLYLALLPWYWLRVWQRKMGDTALAIVGSEILCWGYSMFGINAGIAWVGLVAGSIVMMRFGWAGMRANIPMAVRWYRLNLVYVVAGLVQLVWILKSVKV